MTIKDLEEKIKKSASEDTRGLHLFSSRTRRDVYRELSRLPCRTSSSIGTSLGVDSRVVEWHLKKIRKGGFVEMWRSGKTYFYIPQLLDVSDLEFFSLLNNRGIRTIVRYVLEGCRQIKEIPLARSTLYRHLGTLEDADIITINRGSRGYVCATPQLLRLREKYAAKGPNFKREFVKMLEIPGFTVTVIGEVAHELKLEVKGLENFTMGVFISPLETALEV